LKQYYPTGVYAGVLFYNKKNIVLKDKTKQKLRIFSIGLAFLPCSLAQLTLFPPCPWSRCWMQVLFAVLRIGYYGVFVLTWLISAALFEW
jgi:hypothetical protein